MAKHQKATAAKASPAATGDGGPPKEFLDAVSTVAGYVAGNSDPELLATAALNAACKIAAAASPGTDTMQLRLDSVLAQMGRIVRTRDLLQLLMALSPKRIHAVESIVGRSAARSVEEVALVYGVSTGTVVGNWIPNGLPTNQE